MNEEKEISLSLPIHFESHRNEAIEEERIENNKIFSRWKGDEWKEEKEGIHFADESGPATAEWRERGGG